MMTFDEIQANCKRIAELQEEMDRIKDESRTAFLEQQKDMIQLLFDGVMPTPTVGVRRGRPKGSSNKGPREPRSMASRFSVSLSRLMNGKATPAVTPDRDEAEKLLNDAAASVAAKNDVEVPDDVWKRIDEHLTEAYGPKAKGKTKKAEG